MKTDQHAQTSHGGVEDKEPNWKSSLIRYGGWVIF